MWCLRILLMIWINPFLFFLVGLNSLGKHSLLSNTSQILFHGSVRDDLLSSNDLELHRVHFVLFSQLILHHLLLSYLHLSLEVYLVNLSLVEPLEVIWLHSIWTQHAHLSSGILRHEISIVCEIKLNFLLMGPILMLLHVSVLLLLDQDFVNSKCLHSGIVSVSVMLALSVFKVLVKGDCLLVEQGVGLSFEFFAKLLLFYLLLAPVLLL